MVSNAMDTRAYVVPIRDLDVAGKPFEFELPVSWLSQTLETCEAQPTEAPGVARVELSKTGDTVLVRGTIDVLLTVPCARCLTDVRFRPEVELDLVLEPVAGAASALPSNVKRLPVRGARRAALPEARQASRGGGEAPATGARRGAGAGAAAGGKKAAGAAGAAKATSAKSAAGTAGTAATTKGHARPRRDEEDDVELVDADTARDTYDGEEVVLDSFFREALLLESPIFPLCSDTCEGIRPAQASAAFPDEGGGSEPRIAIRTQPSDRQNSKE